MTQIAEYTVKRLALIALVFLFVISVATPFIPTAKALPTYSYNFDGPVDEATATYLPDDANVTAHFSSGTGADESFLVNHAYIYNTTNTVRYFSYEYNFSGNIQHREYWLDPTEVNQPFMLWLAFSPYATNHDYTISFLDYTGQLQTYPYIEIINVGFGSYYTEKKLIDVQTIVVANLREGGRYQIRYTDGTTVKIFGEITTTATIGIQLVVRGVDFTSDAAKKQLLLYQYVHAYAQRDFLNPIGAITVSYEDLTSQTTSVTITITDNGTTVYNTVYTSQTFSDTWNSAVNSTSYEVTISVVHATFGSFHFNQYLLGEYQKASDPFSLAFLGSSMGISTAVLLPALLIIFVAGCFSELTSETAAILTVIIAIILSALGWINIGQGAIISALALAVMSGIIAAKRRMNVY